MLRSRRPSYRRGSEASASIKTRRPSTYLQLSRRLVSGRGPRSCHSLAKWNQSGRRPLQSGLVLRTARPHPGSERRTAAGLRNRRTSPKAEDAALLRLNGNREKSHRVSGLASVSVKPSRVPSETIRRAIDRAHTPSALRRCSGSRAHTSHGPARGGHGTHREPRRAVRNGSPTRPRAACR